MTRPETPTVALVAHALHDEGGMERAFAELVRRTGSQVRFVVVARTLADDLRPLVEWSRVRIPGRPAPLRFVLFFLVAGVRVARLRPRVDLVHTLGAIVPNSVDVATVHHCHRGSLAAMGLTPPGLSPLRALNTAVARSLALLAERWCYRPARVRFLPAVSAGTRREIERWYPGVAAPVTPNGVDVARFRRDLAQRAAVRRELGVGDGTVAALFVGGNWELKGLGVAIEALARARRRTRTPLELWVVGRGDERRARSLARSHGVEACVRLLGRRPDVERFDAAADLFVLPSLYETFSLVAYEAAAAELPVVATRVSGIDELVGDGAAGILVRRDADDVADAFVRLADDPALRRRLGGEARRRASSFDWQRAADSVLHVYRAAGADTTVTDAA